MLPGTDAAEEDVCEAISFTGVLPASVFAKDVSDDKLKSSDVIVPIERYG